MIPVVSDTRQEDFGNSILPLALSIVVFVFAVLLINVVLLNDDYIRKAYTFIPKLRLLNSWVLSVICSVLLGLVLAANIYLSFKHKFFFFMLALLSFGLSEINIIVFNVVMLMLRLSFMVVSIVLGVLYFSKKNNLSINNFLAVGMLFIIFVNFQFDEISFSALMALPMQVAMFFGIFFGLRHLYQKISDIEKIGNIIGILAVFMIIFHSMYLLFDPGNAILSGRFRSFFLLPTNFANSFIFFMVGLIWLFLKEQRAAISFFYCLFILVGIYLLFLSGTRNALLGLVVAGACFALVWRAKVCLLLTLVFASVGGIFLVALQSEAFGYLSQRFINFKSKSTLSRFEVWDRAWSYIKEKPILGYGLGGGESVLNMYVEKWAALNSHNAYLGLWLQVGLVGLIFILALYLLGFLRGLSVIFSNRKDKQVIILPFALLLVLFICGFFEENLTSRGSIQQLIFGISLIAISSFKAFPGEKIP